MMETTRSVEKHDGHYKVFGGGNEALDLGPLWNTIISQES